MGQDANKCFGMGNKLTLQESNMTLVDTIRYVVGGNCGLFSAKTVEDLHFLKP
jgi:hypothetical protein